MGPSWVWNASICHYSGPECSLSLCLLHRWALNVHCQFCNWRVKSQMSVALSPHIHYKTPPLGFTLSASLSLSPPLFYSLYLFLSLPLLLSLPLSSSLTMLCGEENTPLTTNVISIQLLMANCHACFASVRLCALYNWPELAAFIARF